MEEQRPDLTLVKPALALATDAVCRVHRVHLAHLESRANQVSLEHLACQDRLVSRRNHRAKWSLHLLANRVLLVHQVHPVPLVHLETLAIKEHPDAQAQMRPQDHQDHPAHLDLLDPLVPMDHPAIPELQLRVNQFSLANLAMPAMLVLLVPLVHLAIQAKTENLVNPDPKALRDRPAHLEATVSPARPARLVHRVHQARRVFVPNTALWTAVCSSKTERGDKQLRRLSQLPAIFDNVSRGIIELAFVVVSLSIISTSSTKREITFFFT